VEVPKPPKSPTTDAGAAIIESVLAAAELVIEHDGLERFTTNRRARRCQRRPAVSVLPNKQAVLAELARRLERCTQAQSSRSPRRRARSLEATAARVA
jgi:hypothetical protein